MRGTSDFKEFIGNKSTVLYLYGTAHSLIPEKVGSRQPAEILFRGRSGGDAAERLIEFGEIYFKRTVENRSSG